MNWLDKIKAGMNLIADGCREQNTLSGCRNCPLDKFCATLCIQTELPLPENWPDWKYK